MPGLRFVELRQDERLFVLVFQVFFETKVGTVDRGGRGQNNKQYRKGQQDGETRV
jgi:hypothetical protein